MCWDTSRPSVLASSASLLCFAAAGSTGWWASAATFNQCGASALSEEVSSALTRIDLTRGVVNAARAGNVALAKRLTAAAGLAAECARSADRTLHGAAWRRYQSALSEDLP